MGATSMVTFSVGPIASRLAGGRGSLLTYMQVTELGIACYKIMCIDIICAAWWRELGCVGSPMGETTVHIIINDWF